MPPKSLSALAEISNVQQVLQNRELELYSLTSALSHAFDGTAKFSVEGIFESVNDPYALTFGYDDQEYLIGKTWRTTIYDEDEFLFEDAMMTCLHSDSVHIRVRGVQKSGLIFPMKLAIVRVPPIDRGLDCTGFYSFVHDLR